MEASCLGYRPQQGAPQMRLPYIYAAAGGGGGGDLKENRRTYTPKSQLKEKSAQGKEKKLSINKNEERKKEKSERI